MLFGSIIFVDNINQIDILSIISKCRHWIYIKIPHIRSIDRRAHHKVGLISLIISFLNEKIFLKINF
jgi:hypothetical protein